ncbi:MAG: UTP--glucose-1-phosphate uridylyltransferase [Actinomycetales bacterium]|nr:UTP--glucose-1-phosphate uridylyltransferase [Actinomycetales bacterium]
MVRKAVIPVAGLGTRFLPATKATPKEMMPVVDKPAIQYVVEEAAAAGMDDLLFVTGRNKRALEDHFDENHELEAVLARKGSTALLAAARDPASLASIHYVRQGTPRGLGHAVACARIHVGDQPFAVLLGDDLIDPRDYILTRMAQVHERTGGSVIALMAVPPSEISLYGCAAVVPTAEADVVAVTDLVEKPPAGSAPSQYAIIGRYVLTPQVFDVLDQTSPGSGGEIQLTDALRVLAHRPVGSPGAGVTGVVFTGRRYDTGDKQSYLRSVVRIAVDRADLGPPLREYLRELVAGDFDTSHG